MKIQVSTKEFELAHGKRPKGLGNWAFKFQGDLAIWWATENGMSYTQGGKLLMYTQAKALACNEARIHGADSITVQP